MTEKLSNLMDHSVNESDLDEFLRACKSDPQLVDTWQRYHIASAGLKNEISQPDLEIDVADKVLTAIKDQHPSKPESVVVPLRPKVLSRPWVSMALAASLLLGVYMVMTQFAVEKPLSTVQLADAVDVNTMPHWQTSNAAIENTLNSLLVEHSEFTSVTGMNGLGSYSKFVAYQN